MYDSNAKWASMEFKKRFATLKETAERISAESGNNPEAKMIIFNHDKTTPCKNYHS